jgi:hypothetical protein
MKNYLLSSRCARCLKMPRRLVNREEQGRLIAQTSGAITMINESNYSVRSKSGYNTQRHCGPFRVGLFMSRLYLSQCQVQARICS